MEAWKKEADEAAQARAEAEAEAEAENEATSTPPPPPPRLTTQMSGGNEFGDIDDDDDTLMDAPAHQGGKSNLLANGGGGRKKKKGKPATPRTTPSLSSSPSKSRGGTPKSVSKMQWGILPNKMIEFDEIRDALPVFKVSVNEENPKYRTGAIAKKLYSQLTSLYAHYSAIRKIVDEQQPQIDNAQRKAKNANIKMRKMQSKFGSLKERLAAKEEQVEALQAMVEKLNEKQMRNMRKLMAAWRNKSLISCFNAWKGWVVDEKGTKLKMRKFLLKMPQAGLAKCFTGWAFYVSEIRREQRLLARFAARWKSMSVFKTFSSWKEAWKMAKWERELLRKNGMAEEDEKTNNTDRDWLSGKQYHRHTNASKNYDLNPARMKELKHDMKVLRDENRHLKETITNLKSAAINRSMNPTKIGGSQRKIRNNLHSIVTTQKNIHKYMNGQGNVGISPLSFAGSATF